MKRQLPGRPGDAQRLDRLRRFDSGDPRLDGRDAWARCPMPGDAADRPSCDSAGPSGRC